MEEEKKCKLEREIANEAVGKMGDVEFEMMIEKYKKHEEKPMINVHLIYYLIYHFYSIYLLKDLRSLFV